MSRTATRQRRKPGTARLLLRYTKVRGTLSWADHDVPILGTIIITQDGTITITTRRIALNKKTAWVLERVPAKGRLATWAKLRATTPDGLRLESDHVTMTGRNSHTGPRTRTFALSGQLSRLTVHHKVPPATAATCMLIYHTIGMQGFGVQEARTTLGTIRMAGPATIDDYDHLAGKMQITAHEREQRTVDEWTNACDDEMQHTLLILSLAEGKLLEWSIRQSATTDGTVFRNDYYGPKHTGTPRDLLFHWLNLQPVLDLAVTRYTQALRDTTGVELAIRLLLAQPGHVEFQLVSAMTALEHLTSAFNKQTAVPPLLPADIFTTVIRPGLEQAFDIAIATIPGYDTPPLSDRARILRSKIAGLNNTVLNERLNAMLRDYGVPVEGLEPHIANAIRARNDIIHHGRFKTAFDAFYRHVAVLRELIKRIILTLFGFRGQYISFLNGQEFLEFPPKNTTVT